MEYSGHPVNRQTFGWTVSGYRLCRIIEYCLTPPIVRNFLQNSTL
nr:unnamed protein product [Callosobruchus chinensis]